MGEITSVSNEWATRPADERFTSLAALQAFLDHRDSLTVEAVRPLAKLQVQPLDDRMLWHRPSSARERGRVGVLMARSGPRVLGE